MPAAIWADMSINWANFRVLPFPEIYVPIYIVTQSTQIDGFAMQMVYFCYRLASFILYIEYIIQGLPCRYSKRLPFFMSSVMIYIGSSRVQTAYNWISLG